LLQPGLRLLLQLLLAVVGVVPLLIVLAAHHLEQARVAVAAVWRTETHIQLLREPLILWLLGRQAAQAGL
jgi:hypothetical protein